MSDRMAIRSQLLSGAATAGLTAAHRTTSTLACWFCAQPRASVDGKAGAIVELDVRTSMGESTSPLWPCAAWCSNARRFDDRQCSSWARSLPHASKPSRFFKERRRLLAVSDSCRPFPVLSAGKSPPNSAHIRILKNRWTTILHPNKTANLVRYGPALRSLSLASL